MIPLRHSLALAALLRLVYATSVWCVTGDFASFETPDSEGYMVLARELVETGSFSNGDGPELFRPPGYPLLLSLGLLGPSAWVSTILLQIGLGTLTVWLVYQFALKLGSEEAARWGALLFAIEPLSIAYTSVILSETLLAFMLALLAVVLVGSLEGPSVARLTLAAVVVSSLAYVKAIAWFLPFAIGATLVAVGLARRQGRTYSMYAAGLVLGCAILVAPWHLRNHSLTEYAGFSTQIDRGIYFLAATAVRADQQGISHVESRSASDVEFDEIQQQRRSPDEWGPAIRGKGLAVLLGAPFTTSKVLFQGAAVDLLDPAAGLFYRQFDRDPTGFALAARSEGYMAVVRRFAEMSPARRTFIGLLELVALSYLVLALAGIVALRKTHPGVVVGLVVVVAYFLLLSGSMGHHRFRVPLIPVFCGFAGYGVLVMISTMKQYRTSDG